MIAPTMTPQHARLTLEGLRVRYLCQADSEGAGFAARALARLPEAKRSEVRAAREVLEAVGIIDRAGALLPAGLPLAFQVGQAVTAGEALPGLPVAP
ncbi:hypothetical protein [Deinococcus frigens]|uniref:hypothetical protein n=1 Tax=Deinococcus frigens TaxID=249403 RepID=UPI0004961ACE|nr:hypothetical protein [Deinococcus frigens]